MSGTTPRCGDAQPVSMAVLLAATRAAAVVSTPPAEAEPERAAAGDDPELTGLEPRAAA